MKIGKRTAPSEVDFWLDTDRYSEYIENISLDPIKRTMTFNIDMIRLSSIRTAISNFVRILTRKSIPVYFNDQEVNRNKFGKVIHISSKIHTKDDFDVAVGLALHEGAHTLLSDFNVVMDAWANLPPTLLKKSDDLNIRRASIEKFIHTIWNIVEDRYIDNYVFNKAPGYRGYYVALYNKYFNDPRIDDLLKSDEYRWPSLDSYDFRIANFTNPNTDLTALPRLDDIADVIDISNINKLSTTMKRIKVAFKIVEIVLDCIDKEPTISSMAGAGSAGQQKMVTPEEFFGESDEDGGSDENDKSDDSKKESKDMGSKMIEEISDIISGRDKNPSDLKENKDAVEKISQNPNSDLEKLHKEINKKQREFLMGDIPKQPVTPAQKELLDLIQQHGIVLVHVGNDLLPGDTNSLRVQCIVVEKLTKQLILKGKDIFPMSGAMGEDNVDPPKEVEEAVKNGIIIGTKLGRKLQLRTEVNPIKSLRKKSGKINKRQLHEVACGVENIFYKVQIESHNKATLHITVDASSSMSGEKWNKTMTAVVAICKATSMIDNIHVTVSFRTTQSSQQDNSLPYVVLAYDSNVDKFSKIRSLFPYLEPNGLTPEGLAFEAIMGLFDGITPDEEDRYFLNLSDGEPCYYYTSPDASINVSYTNEVGVSHTKSQVNKIRRRGVQVLSYFIEGGESQNSIFKLFNPHSNNTTKQFTYNEILRENFRKMYGKDAKFIDVENIIDLAKTMNGLFLANNKNS